MNTSKSLGTLRGLRRSADHNVSYTSSRRGAMPLLKEETSIENIINSKLTGVMPQKFNFTRDVIDHWALYERSYRRNPRYPALHIVGEKPSQERKINYTELSQLTKRLAAVFVNDLGLSRRDRILISLPKCPEFFICTLAALRAGLEFTTVTTQAVGEDLRFRIQQFQPSVIISDNMAVVKQATDYPNCPVKFRLCAAEPSTGAWLNVNSLIAKCQSSYDGAETNSDDPAMVFFTSGTTGFPKMVQHTNEYTLAHMTSDTNLLRLKTDDEILCTADTGWAKSAFGFYPAFLSGAGFVVNTSPKFCAKQLSDVLSTYNITRMSSVPTIYRMMLKENRDLRFKALSAVYSGGEPLNCDAFIQWKKRTGLEIREGYGQTETMMLCTGNPDFPAKPGSMGIPAPEFQIAILDDGGNPVGCNEVGHFALKIKPRHPLGLFVGYKNNPEKTAQVFAGNYYLTGDKVTRDTDGYFWFVGRADDVITSAGYRIGPHEIEVVLLKHPAVLEAAVVGSPDAERVEIVKAFVVLREEYRDMDQEKLAREIQEFTKKLTAPYKYPRKIEFRSELPKTTTGKVQRHVLRAEEREKRM